MAPCHTLANDKQYHLFAIFVRPRESTAIDQAHQYYRAYASKINRYILLKTNDPELSADLTHESFARLFTLLQQKESVEKPLAYLYTVANHLVIDHLRSHATSRTDRGTCPSSACTPALARPSPIRKPASTRPMTPTVSASS
ncbi:RNA polymerase sigma factor [Halopseudomonas xiamenensis]|uniref:RNA polymerase sigma factor n=1 Tax=Halopseudomonas xiamenensis TaxID=157792 RepID=UPI001C8A10C7